MEELRGAQGNKCKQSQSESYAPEGKGRAQKPVRGCGAVKEKTKLQGKGREEKDGNWKGKYE